MGDPFHKYKVSLFKKTKYIPGWALQFLANVTQTGLKRVFLGNYFLLWIWCVSKYLSHWDLTFGIN